MRDETLRARTAACARCGTCRTVCTLYPERKTENSVARGKISLIDAALSGRDGDLDAIQAALSDCLLCGRCERACPNGVPVEEILMAARGGIAGEIGLPAWKRVLFGKVMPSRARRGGAAVAAAAAQGVLAKRIPTASGLHYRFPAGIAPGGRTFPRLPAKGFLASLAPGKNEPGDAVLFAGCVFDHVLPEVGRAAWETMKASGMRVSAFRDAACCGLPALVSGDPASALLCAEDNVRRMRAARPEKIVFPCGSCLAMFRRHLPSLFPESHPLHEDAAWVAARCMDYAGFLLETGAASSLAAPPGARPPGKVGYHDPCHLSGTLGKGPEAREILRRAVGRSFAEMPGADLCCGLGGTFSLRDYATSSRIGERKVVRAAEEGFGTVATACSGCILQLRDMAARVRPSLRIVHIAELASPALSRR